MRFQLEKHGSRDVQVQPEYKQVSDDTVIGSARLVDEDGNRHERFEVITFRDGKIIDMQGCTSLREAERFARRHARSRG